MSVESSIFCAQSDVSDEFGDEAVSPPNVITTDCGVSFALAADLDTPTRISFLEPQRYVALDIRSGLTVTPVVSLKAYDASSEPAELVMEHRTTAPPSGWRRLSVAADRIDYVEYASDQTRWHIDDLTISDEEQPDTEIVGGPPDETTDRDASFTVRSSIEGATFGCALDGLEVDCDDLNFTDLAVGEHTLTARATDDAGLTDPTPASRTWTIVPVVTPPPPPPPPADRDGDLVIDSADNCPDNANATQADEDTDGVGDACEVLPSGDLPPVAGVRATVRVTSGEVFVRLPRSGGASASQLRPGFVPLKGVAAVPVGSTIDATKGQLAMTSAAAFGRGRKGRVRARSRGTFAAAIFTIKQRRARQRGRPRRPTTDLVLRSPPRAEAACAARRPPSGPKGIVRTLTGTAKGQFRAIGGASTTTVRNATFVTTDRCNGTLTEVGRGRAAVFDRARDRTVTVRAGQAYLARARLFQARKGRNRP
jgi:Thrombospondin type 3 repeat